MQFNVLRNRNQALGCFRDVQLKVDAVLAPELRLGDMVVMDHLRLHKTRGVRKVMEANGVELLLLPSCPPSAISSSGHCECPMPMSVWPPLAHAMTSRISRLKRFS